MYEFTSYSKLFRKRMPLNLKLRWYISERLLAPRYKSFVMPGSACGYPHHIRVGAGGADTKQVAKGLAELARFFRNQSQ